MSKGFWPNFDQVNISHRRPCSAWIVNLLTWQKAPEGGYDEKSWEMACNWLMMTSSGDDNRPSGSLGLLTDKTKKKNKKNKPKAEQETAQPTAARFNDKKFTVDYKISWCFKAMKWIKFLIYPYISSLYLFCLVLFHSLHVSFGVSQCTWNSQNNKS